MSTQDSGAGGPHDNPYFRVPVRRPRKVEFAGAPALGMRIEALEICQSVQALDNSVTLIAMKPTVLRLYLDHGSVTKSVKLRGEVVWRRSPTGPASYLPGLNEIRVDPGDALDVNDQRDDFRHSLNFRLPDDAIRAGKVWIEIGRLIQTGGDDQPFSGATTLEADFVAAPPIRVRCIGLRYLDNTGDSFTPDATHFTFFRSFLNRAYPVPDVIWSQIVVDADFGAPFNSLSPVRANAQLAAIRNSEINAGTDPRTHYYGLVDDANGQYFMRGRASGIPQVPQPDTVASGPCGVPGGFAGDNDLSYADWYGAHELGHTFGRFHPGFPVGAQDASDPAFPYDNGQISNANRKYVGYDLGDEALQLEVKALNGTQHHDIMTYAERQWVSAHTFEAVRQRLLDEDTEFAPQVG